MPAEASGERLEKLTALALLLPPFVLAWPGPGSILRSDFLPHATGAGALALATLPAALLLLLRGARLPAIGLALLAVLPGAAALWLALGEATDTFEAARFSVHAASALTLFACGASLGPVGRRVYAHGIVVVALAFVLTAIVEKSREGTGALGNTGSVAMGSLPGVLAGMCLFASISRAWKTAGMLLTIAFVHYVVRAPVIAACLALAAALGIAGLLRKGLRMPMLAAFGVIAVTAALTVVVPPVSGPSPAPEDSPTSRRAGGFEVRARIWSRSLAMLGAHPLAGAGPGQFAARFPPWRDPNEIELSTHGRASGTETEVEHPHQDWLAPALELGAPAGLAWVAFLALVALAALKSLRGAEDEGAALACAALGLLAYAFVHAPLTAEPAASSIAFAVFGAVLARSEAAASTMASRAIPLVLLFVLAARAPAALSLLRHGRALAPLAREGSIDEAVAAQAIGSALAARGDSSLALSLSARLEEERGALPGVARAAWVSVLARRPHSVEARMQFGMALAVDGDFTGARAQYERARELDPGHPGIRKNLDLIDLQEGRLEDGRAWLAGEASAAEECHARSKEVRAAGDEILADLLEARAHLLWARGHAAAGRFDDAVRSYRQAVRVTRKHVDGGAARVRIELAAALAASGKADEARAERDEARTAARDGLPAWAVDALASIE